MTADLEAPVLAIPENIRGTFRRMLNRAPREIREDPEFQRKMLIFLKFGNESMVRQYTAIHKVQLIEQLSLIKKHARDIVESEAETTLAEGDTDPGGANDVSADGTTSGGDEVAASAESDAVSEESIIVSEESIIDSEESIVDSAESIVDSAEDDTTSKEGDT